MEVETNADDFDAAFAEFSNPQEAPAVAAAPAVEAAETDEAEEVVSTATETDAPSAAPAQEETLESLRKKYEEAEARATQLQHRLLSDEGRFQAAQRILREHQSAAGKAAPAPTTKQIEAAAASPSKLAALKADFPDVAEAVEEALVAAKEEARARVEQELGKVRAELAPTQKIASDIEMSVRYDEVEKAHAGWKNTIKEPQFLNWLSGRRPAVIELYYSEEPADAVELLTMYRHAHPAPAGDVSASPAAPQKSDRLARAASTSTGRQPAATPIAPDDFDGAFAYFAKRRETLSKSNSR